MKKYYKIGKIFGIEIGLHYSWFFIFFFLAYILSNDYFPQYFPDLSKAHYWLVGTLSALFLFVSVLLHELCHSLVAKAHKIPIRRIQLFFFGGVAEIEDENITPQTELVMSLAGPVFSIAFAMLCFYITPFVTNITFQAVLHYLARINLVLGIFNLMPGFPLDGGRALRALLWMFTKDIEKATYIATRSGKVFGGLLMFLGFLSILGGNLGGLWFILIGGFLFFMAEVSFEQVVIKNRLTHIKVKEVYDKDFDALDPEETITRALDTILHSSQNVFPVTDKKHKLLGIVSLQKLQKIPEPIRKKIKIKQVMLPKSKTPKVTLNQDIYPLILDMAKNGLPLFPVMKKDKVVGILSKEQVMHYLRVKLAFNI